LGGKSLVCGPARAESPTSPQPRATPWVPCSQSLRPVRAKVKVNHSPILLPLQGVGVYTLIPRALPWAMNWLPFQGAPFRTLFVYHVRMLRHLLFGSKPRRDFSGFCPRPNAFSRSALQVIDSRPRVTLPSAASSATCGREQHEQRPRADNFSLSHEGH
jgi:hypothetical protein